MAEAVQGHCAAGHYFANSAVIATRTLFLVGVLNSPRSICSASRARTPATSASTAEGLWPGCLIGDDHRAIRANPRLRPQPRTVINGPLTVCPDHQTCPLWTLRPDKKPSPSLLLVTAFCRAWHGRGLAGRLAGTGASAAHRCAHHFASAMSAMVMATKINTSAFVMRHISACTSLTRG
jgi:hypothetical protein